MSGARWQQAIKRGADTLAAALLLIAAAPVIAACALAIRVADRGPAVFRQRRAGRWGRPFLLYKLRTMHVDADRILERHLEESAAARDEWARYRRLRNDPRVLGRLGSWMRGTSLDELPQLWNVLRGDMSLVGPRPLELSVVERLDPATCVSRASVRPGMTGLWQVSGRSDVSIAELVAIDNRYVNDWSLWGDFVILCRTPAAVFTRRGAY